MSAIVKPFIHSTTATNIVPGTVVSPLVCVERVTNVAKVLTPATENHSRSPRFEIHFQMAQDQRTGVAKDIIWEYADETDLDADWALIVNTISAVVA